MREIMRAMVSDLTRHLGPCFQSGAPGGEANFGEAQEDEAKESFRTGTIEIRFGKVGRRHCLLGSVPEALFERRGGGVFFRWGDPDHKPFPK